jgi:hypothetical protein
MRAVPRAAGDGAVTIDAVRRDLAAAARIAADQGAVLWSTRIAESRARLLGGRVVGIEIVTGMASPGEAR